MFTFKHFFLLNFHCVTYSGNGVFAWSPGCNFMIFSFCVFCHLPVFCGFCNRTVSCQSRGDFSQTPALLRLGANGLFPFHAHATRAMWFHKFYTKSMNALERSNFDFCCTTYLKVLHLSDWSISQMKYSEVDEVEGSYVF